MSWLRQTGMISNRAAGRYRIDSVSPHNGDMSGQSLQTDDGGVRGNRGAIGVLRQIDDQQRQAKFGPTLGNNAGNAANFGPDAFNSRHIGRGPMRKKWARGTDMKARRTILDRPERASAQRVKAASSTQYPESGHYNGRKPPRQNAGA